MSDSWNLWHVASSEWLLSVSGVQLTPLPVFLATVYNLFVCPLASMPFGYIVYLGEHFLLLLEFGQLCLLPDVRGGFQLCVVLCVSGAGTFVC